MEPAASAPATPRRRQLDEIAEALPERAATLTRLFLRRATIAITRTEAGVVYALRDQPRRITELAAREGVTQPAITLLVNRLEQRGWLMRTPDPSDGRAVLVSLTPAGREALAQLRTEYRALLHEEMARLDDGDVDTLARAIEILERLIDQLQERDS
jgi:DNA-binding MarR family transcriptional regulator